MDNFWGGFRKQASSARTVGQVLEGLAYGLARRAGQGTDLAEAAIDAYFKNKPESAMNLWRQEAPQELLKEVRWLNQATKHDPSMAEKLLMEMKDAK